MIHLLKYNHNIKYLVFILTSVLWAAVFFNIVDFVDNPVNDLQSFLFVFFQFGLQVITVFFLLYAAGTNKYFFLLFFPLFAVLGAIISYYKYAYNVVLTPMLIDATLHNDLRTSMDVISFPMIAFVVLSLIISLFFVRYRIKKISKINIWVPISISIISMFFLLNINSRMKNSIMIRFPYNVYFNLKEYKRFQMKILEERTNPDANLICSESDSLLVVLVLGESLRADHLSLNGYERKTTPNLEKRQHLISFPNIYSEYTHTARSIPHILTRADSVHVERAFTETSFVPLFKSCDFKTYWIANQESGDYYIAFMKECDSLI